jgi:NAD(P)-dependent dehydrogenase (short-subunit alcohol dehydrogenase family)
VAHSSARAAGLLRGERYRNTPNALRTDIRRLHAPPPRRKPRERENAVDAKNAQGKEASAAAASAAAARPRIQDETAAKGPTFRTNIFSFFFMTKAAMKHLKKDAAIINTTSRGKKRLRFS